MLHWTEQACIISGVTALHSGCTAISPSTVCREMAKEYPPRKCHSVKPCLRLSGLEPRPYNPSLSNMRSTFMNIGERCNVAGSTIYKKAIVDGDYEKALGIATKQVC